MLIKLENGVPTGLPIVEPNFRLLFPNLPAYLSPEVVEPLGYGLYATMPHAELGRYEKAVEGTPVKNEAGMWLQNWTVRPMTDEERAAHDDNKAALIRMARHNKLTMCDWTHTTDSTLPAEKKAEWAAYRQQLRDITTQPGFPWDVVWPDEPM